MYTSVTWLAGLATRLVLSLARGTGDVWSSFSGLFWWASRPGRPDSAALRLASLLSLQCVSMTALSVELCSPFRLRLRTRLRPEPGASADPSVWVVSEPLASALRREQTLNQLCWCDHGWVHGQGSLLREPPANVSGWLYVTMAFGPDSWTRSQSGVLSHEAVVVGFAEEHRGCGFVEHVAVGLLCFFAEHGRSGGLPLQAKAGSGVSVELCPDGPAEAADWLSMKKSFVGASTGAFSGLAQPGTRPCPESA